MPGTPQDTREKKSPIIEKGEYDNVMFHWYIVVWSNKDIKGTQKVGKVFGRRKAIEGRRSISINKKVRDFQIAEKYALIGRMTGKDFKEYMRKVEA